MCTFITATLPREAEYEQLLPICKAYRMSFSPINNSHILPQLPREERYLWATGDYCDCGTVLGSFSYQQGQQERPDGYWIKKLRKQGWGESKIRRWFDQKTQTKLMREREDKAGKESMTGKSGMRSVKAWCEFLTALLKSGHTGRVGLMLHVYSSSVFTERVTISTREKVRLIDLTPEVLLTMKQDTLYEFML